MGLSSRKRKTGSDVTRIPELPSLNLNGVKIDTGRAKQCLALLNKLMNHHFGWVFNHPVDPVKLGIPDYFSIIRNPMDLGTIKQNLLKGFYMSTVHFAEDVILTFSNAMLYNPPTNDVHIMAKELRNVFDARWKFLEDKWANETSNCNLDCMEAKSRKENPSYSSRMAESGPAKKKIHLSVSCAVKAKPAEPVTSRNTQTLIQGSAQASCKDKPQSGIRIEKRSDNGRLVFKIGSYNSKLFLNQDFRQTSIATKISEVDESHLEVPLSPSRALRAATLKCRFADTIAKAQQRTLLNQDNKVDPAKLQKERAELERKQQEEKMSLEAMIRAAQAAARMKAETNRKLMREKEREAARLSLQQIKKTIDLDNTELLEDLQRMNLTWTCHRRTSKLFKQKLTCGLDIESGFLNPLEKLGLFIKDDYIDDEDLEIPAKADVEEGEICF